MNENDFGFLVQIITNYIHHEIPVELEQLGITVRQGKFLGYLHENKNRTVSQKELQNHFEITHPTTVGIVKRLEAKGMIRTRHDDADKRLKIIELAEGEERVHETMKALKKRTDAQLFRGFSKKEYEQLMVLLQRIYENTYRTHEK